MLLAAGAVYSLYCPCGLITTRRVVIAGVLCGLAMLARPNFIVFLPLAALYVWLRHRFRLSGILRVCIFLSVTILTISPWTTFNYIRSGGALIPVTTGGGYNFWLGNSVFKRIDISAMGQNIWFNAINFPKYVNFDTNTLSLGVGNGLGFDFITGPSSTRYGGSIKIIF